MSNIAFIIIENIEIYKNYKVIIKNLFDKMIQLLN